MNRKGMMLLVFVLGGITPVALAQPADETPQRPFGGPHRRLIEELNLTDQQKKELENGRFEFAKQVIALRSKASTARVELEQLLRADNPEKMAIEKKIGDISQIQTQGRMLAVNRWFSVNKMLTPEQQKVWKKALGQRQMFAGRGHGIREMRDGFRDGPRTGMREFRKRMIERRRMME